MHPKSNTMTSRTDTILTVLKIVSWIIFIGLCIQTGALLFNYIFSLFRPVATNNLYQGLNLSELYNQSQSLYSFLFSFVIVLSGLKAFVFYLVIKLFMKLNLMKPFDEAAKDYITRISWFVFFTGICSHIAHRFTKHLLHKGYEAEAVSHFWNGTEAYLLMAAVLFVIAQIFKNGIELQQENDLTV